MSRLDELDAAHAAVGGVSPGRRYTTDQVNRAYVLTLSAQFQGFCRELHSEAAIFLAGQIQPQALVVVVAGAMQTGRKLDTGNPNPGNLGSDFGRIGMDFWTEVNAREWRNAGRQRRLEQLSIWRNAIAHDDANFTPQQQTVLGASTPTLLWARRWRMACHRLTEEFDRAVRTHIFRLTGHYPWT